VGQGEPRQELNWFFMETQFAPTTKNDKCTRMRVIPRERDPQRGAAVRRNQGKRKRSRREGHAEDEDEMNPKKREALLQQSSVVGLDPHTRLLPSSRLYALLSIICVLLLLQRKRPFAIRPFPPKYCKIPPCRLFYDKKDQTLHTPRIHVKCTHLGRDDRSGS
jgi:hypothetical protein